MIMGIAALVFIPLLAAALACFMWAIGRTWPLRDKAMVAGAVSGRTAPAALPSRWIFLLASIGFLAAGIVALSLADPVAGGWWLDVLGALFGLAFLARGIVGYTGGWRTTHATEPFATIDRKTYSPAALLIGAGLLLLVVLRLV